MVRGFVFIVLEYSVVGWGVELKPAGFIRDYGYFFFVLRLVDGHVRCRCSTADDSSPWSLHASTFLF